MSVEIDVSKLRALSRQTGISVDQFLAALAPPIECSATTIEEAREAYNCAPDGSRAQQAAWEKCEKLAMDQVAKATTIKEAQHAYDYAPSGSPAEQAALEKWKELAMDQVAKASSIEEAQRAYFCSPRGSPTKQAALLKMCQIAEVIS